MTAGSRRQHLLATAVVLASAAAGHAQSAVGLTEQVSRLRGQLAATEAERQRLLAVATRHALGLSTPLEAWATPSAEERSRAREDSEKLLLDEQVRSTGLSVRLQEVESQLAQAQEEERRRSLTPSSVGQHDLLAPPGAATAMPTPAVETAPATEAPVAEAQAEPQAAAPAPAPGRPPRAEPVLVRGSLDHDRVGRALFRIGRVERAREELLAAQAGGAELSLLDMFWLARCHEQLGNHSDADALYLDIEARDMQVVDGTKLPGPWARAARVARRHMEWLHNQGGWKPVRGIEEVDWRQR